MTNKTLLICLTLSLGLFISCSESSTGNDPEPEQPNPTEEPSETAGNIEVTTSTSGSGSDEDGFTASVDGDSKSIDLNDSVTFEDLEKRTYSIELSGLAQGCAVEGDNPKSIEVKVEETVTASFNITCEVSTAEGTIAYAEESDGKSYLFTMDADGSNKQQVTDNEYDSWPALSPNGDKIAFVRRDLGSGTLDNEIWVVDVNGENTTQLTSNTTDDKRPGWSPDGSKIIYESDDGSSLSIFVMDANGSNPQAITDSNGNDHSATWSQNNSIAFVSDRQGDSSADIYTVQPNGSDLHLLIDATDDNGINLFSPSWSPDGSKIAYQGHTSLGHVRIFTADADGSNANYVTSEEFSAYQPSWSPDGEYIAFMNKSDGSTTDAIWTLKADGTMSYRLTDDQEIYSRFPSWSVTAE